MFKRILILVMIVLCFSSMMMGVSAAQNPEPLYMASNGAERNDQPFSELKAKAAVLVDTTTGKVLFEKNSHDKLPIASVTKVMSLLLIMEALDGGKASFSDTVLVSPNACSMGGSQVYLKQGEIFSIQELLKAVVIHSANDATVALGEYIGGSEEAFIKRMNEKAKELGMADTQFLDCTGLTDEGHYSSAYDVGLMSRELITKHPKILEFTSIRHDTFRDGQFSLDNTNKLLSSYKGINGLKTGFTKKAGHCLSASAKRENLQLVSVVLGEPDGKTRFEESKKLLDFGFANYELSALGKKGDPLGFVEVKKGQVQKVQAGLYRDVQLLLKKGEKEKIAQEINVEKVITAPIDAGQKVGEISYKVNNQVVEKVDIVSLSKVDKVSSMGLFRKIVGKWLGLGKA